MSNFGVLAPAALGSVAAPSAITVATPAAISLPSGTSLAPWGSYQAINNPGFHNVIFTHGNEAMRYVLEGSSLRLGLLAPPTGLTATSTGTRATLTLTDAGGTDFANGDILAIGNGVDPPVQFAFQTTLGQTFNDRIILIKRNGTLATSFANMQKAIESTGTQGTEYFSGHIYNHGGTSTNYKSYTGAEYDSQTATTFVWHVIQAGSGGNSFFRVESVDSGGVYSFGSWTGGATGTGTAPSSGDYFYSNAEHRSTDLALSGVAQNATGEPLLAFSQDGNYNVSLASLPSSFVTRDATDYHRWLRTTIGGKQLYKGKDTTGTTSTDDVTDDVLRGVGSFQFDPRLYRPRDAGYPTVGRYGALWRGRLWVGGAHKNATLTQGQATTTQGSATVTMTTLRVKDDLIGRTFRAASTVIDYRIIDASASAGTITLNRIFVDSGATANYTITDARDQFELSYSEPLLLNNFPPSNSVTGITSRDPSGITGVYAMWDTLVVFTLTGVWRVSGNTGAFRLNNIGEGMGCFSGQSIQAAGNVLYWLGPDGVWAWEPGGLPRSLSSPDGDESAGIQGTIDNINADEAEIIFSNYNPSSGKVRWWVPYSGSTSCNRCLRLNLQTGNFALQTAADFTAAVNVPYGGLTQTVVSDVEGCLWQIDTGYSDGAYGFEPKCTVSSYTVATRSLAITGTTLPTSGDGLAGVPVVIINATTGSYQMAKVSTNTSGAAILLAPITTPSASDIVIFGAIPMDMLSGECDFEEPELMKWVEAITLAHEVESAATEVYCGAAVDNDDPAVFIPRSGSVADFADMTETDSQHHFWLYTARGRSVVFRFLAFARGYRVRCRGYQMSVRTPILEEVEG